MSWKLFLKGRNDDPLTVTDEQGKKINSLLDNITVPKDARINLGDGRPVVEKRDIRFLLPDNSPSGPRSTRVFEAKELKEIKKERDEFYESHKEMSMIDRMWGFYIHKGAMRAIEGYNPAICNLPLYNYLYDVLEELARLERQATFGAKKEIELEKEHESVLSGKKFKI